jgi:hemerythrin
MDMRQQEFTEWSQQMEVGYPLIDAQHRQLFDLAATFNGNDDQIRVMKALAILCDYVKTHLREEEELMAACHYPKLQEHKKLHTEFRLMLSTLLHNAKHLSLDDIAIEVRYLINSWFYRHILTVDQDYAPYLRAMAAHPHPTSEAPPGTD